VNFRPLRRVRAGARAIRRSEPADDRSHCVPGLQRAACALPNSHEDYAKAAAVCSARICVE
jgi:hypothetical protein